MSEFGHSTELQYAAIERRHNRIRLAYDGNGGVYIIDKTEESFSAPFDWVIEYGHLMNSKMDYYKLNDDEMAWVNRMGDFARQLSIPEPA